MTEPRTTVSLGTSATKAVGALVYFLRGGGTTAPPVGSLPTAFPIPDQLSARGAPGPPGPRAARWPPGNRAPRRRDFLFFYGFVQRFLFSVLCSLCNSLTRR